MRTWRDRGWLSRRACRHGDRHFVMHSRASQRLSVADAAPASAAVSSAEPNSGSEACTPLLSPHAASRQAMITQTMVSSRKPDVREFLQVLVAWCRHRADVRAIALVGSWARGEARCGSDLDLVLLTTDPGRYLETDDWALSLGATVVATRQWGVLTERRLIMATGMEVDFGVVDPSWAATAPLDEGTAKVARDGLVPVYDPDAVLERLKQAAG